MSAEATKRLRAMREEIDAINLRLRELLQQRAAVCGNIGRLKREHGMPLVDPSREADMMMALLRDCGGGFSPEALARIFAAILDESRALVLDGPEPPSNGR